MDARQVDPGEEEDEGKSGVVAVFEGEAGGGQEAGPARGAMAKGGGGLTAMETKEMDGSSGSSPQEQGGPGMFLTGDLVEVRQLEIGLRGSWHPAVVIDVKAGSRMVEYDELLTDDGREKLTESIPVDRCLDGGRLGSARQISKSPGKRTRTLLRPRPPPPEDPSASWSKGLYVDCYFKDAWWEGVLTEPISSSGRQKRAVVWFPEEGDWEAMFMKDMRVGQDWDEDTGAWSLKGHIDIPLSKGASRLKRMSLNQKSRGFARNRRRRARDDMELAIALKIDVTTSDGRDAERTGARNSSDSSKDDGDCMISVPLNSPKSAPFTPLPAGPDRSSGHSSMPLALRTRSSEWYPQPLSCRSPRVRTRGEFVSAGATFGDVSDNAASPKTDGVAKMDGEDHRGSAGRIRIITPGKAVVKEIFDSVKQTDPRGVGESGVTAQSSTEKVDPSEKNSGDVESGVKQLIAAGWSVSQTHRKNGKTEWSYKSPNGCLLGSLQSAMGMCNRMEDYNNTYGDEENPTLNDILSPKSGNGSPFIKNRFGRGRTLKSSRRVASPSSVKEGGPEMDQFESSIIEHSNWDIVSYSEPPAGMNGIRESDLTASLSAHLHFKRNAVDCEVIVDDEQLNEPKRRKVQEVAAEQDERSSFYTPLSNGEPFLGSKGIAGEVPLTESKPPAMSSLLDDGPATETRSKKRACLTEDVKHEQDDDLFSAKSIHDSTPLRAGSADYEPKSKKSRVITETICPPSEGKSRKALAILQESSRKKAAIAHRSGESKQAKKASTQVKKSASVKKGKKSRTPSRNGFRLEVLLSAPGTKVEGESGELSRKRTLLSWLIDNGTVSEHEKVRYIHRKNANCTLGGSVTRDGILCSCCRKIVTLSVFEAHAGSKLHRPSANIYLEDGRSLSACQGAALAVKSQIETDFQCVLGESNVDKSDDTCGICGDGGELICCDHCPSTFHLTCMGLQAVPEGDWFCPNCRCASCGDSQFNGDQSTFNDLTVIFCDQCEGEYHVKCLRARGVTLTALPNENFFCGDSCGRIFQGLRSLVGICKPMESGFSSTLLRSGAEDDRKSGCLSNSEINVEHDSKLSIALSVMQECFRPMIDPRTKIDIITHVLYNRRSDVSRLNYHGFYTMLLERGDELISVATIRVHGARLAEMPLIGTRFQYRRQGMCRRLMSAIEEMLFSLGVEHLVLPAVPELLDTWTGAFGFQPMNESQRLQLMDLNIMAFPGTSILYKRLDTLVLRSEALLPTVVQSCGPEGAQLRLPKEHSGVPTVSPAVNVKRRPGRPRKDKKISNCSNGSAVTLPEANVRARKKSANVKTLSESTIASQCVTVKRGPGRPPKKDKAALKPSDEEKLAVSRTEVLAHQFAEAVRDAEQACPPTDVFSGKAALRVTHLLTDEAHEQEKEHLPIVIRGKRGRPPKARISYNLSNEVASSATTVHVDQVAGFSGGQIQISTLGEEPEIEALNLIFPERSSDGEYIPVEAMGDADAHSKSALVLHTMDSMLEEKDPLWLVEHVHDDVKRFSQYSLTGARTCKALALEGPMDIPPLESSMAGNTRTYERRRSGLSPRSETPSRMQDDGSDREPTSWCMDHLEGDDLLPLSEARCHYEAVSVPIRTFPSQFASRGDHNTPPGTFIPVETIVVNSHPKVEMVDEFVVPDCGEPAYSGRDEQSCGGKLLLRLKLPKKKMSSDASCDLETSHPSPTSTIKLPNGGFLPPAFTVTDQIGQEVNRFEQFDQEQLKQPESTIGSHCIPLSVS